MSQIDDNAAQCNLWSDAILVGVRADHVRRFRLACGLKHTEAGCIRILKNDICPAADLCQCLLLSRAYIVPITDVRDHHPYSRVY